MKYLIAHLLTGEAKKYHANLARDLSVRFKTIPLHERIPPHITIKPPFETDAAGIEEVERVLRAFVHNESAALLFIRGFGRFGFRTIYLDVVKSPQAVSIARRTLAVLHANLPWLPHYPHDGNKLHASVARFLTRKQFRRIWRLLRDMTLALDLSFDNIAILKKTGTAWGIHSIISIPETQEGDQVGHGAPLAKKLSTPYALH